MPTHVTVIVSETRLRNIVSCGLLLVLPNRLPRLLSLGLFVDKIFDSHEQSVMLLFWINESPSLLHPDPLSSEVLNSL